MSNQDLVAQTFVALADTLVDDYDVIEFLHLLTGRCAQLLAVEDVGVVLGDEQGNLNVLASSSERMRLVEMIEVQREDGPCLDVWRVGRPVHADRLEEQHERWPIFTPAALSAGFRSAYALPLRLRDQRIGALNLFGDRHDGLPEADAALAQALADIATIGILHERYLREQEALAGQLQTAVHPHHPRTGQGRDRRAARHRGRRRVRRPAGSCSTGAPAADGPGGGGRRPPGALRARSLLTAASARPPRRVARTCATPDPGGEQQRADRPSGGDMVMYRGEERLRPRLGASPEAEDLDLVAITISATSDGLVIRPRGALCAAAAQAFDAVVAAAIASGATRVVVQLDGLTFIDAAALSVFARAHAKAWRRGVDLVVVGADPAILRRFDVAGLRKPLQVQPAGAARSGTGPEAA